MITNEIGGVIKIEDSDVIDGKLLIEDQDFLSINCAAYLQDIKEVEIKDVRVIGANAFENCNELKKISLPKTLFKMDEGVFAGCCNLEEIILPSKIKELKLSTFEGCLKLKDVSLPENLKLLGDSVFEDCSSLESINIPSTVEMIGANTFQNCSSLKNVKLPSSLHSLGAAAFSSCSALEEITIPETVQILENDVFSNCINLKSITLPKELKLIYSNAFQNCSALKEINLSDEIKSIDGYAFVGCESLKEVKLPKELTNLGHSAFKSCFSLEKIEIPSQIKRIEDDCFSGCVSLKEIELSSNLTEIGVRAFKDCKNLDNIFIPASVNRIGKEAFAGCDNLVGLSLGNVYVGEGAFNECSSLEYLDMGAGSQMNDIAPKNLKYLSKIKDRFYLTSEPIDKDSFLVEGSSLYAGVVMALWDERDRLNLSSKDARMYNTMYTLLGGERFAKFYHNCNLNFFRQIEKYFADEKKMSYQLFCKMFYNLGGFEKPIVEIAKTKSGNLVERKVDYAQRVGEFLKEKLSKGTLTPAIVRKQFVFLKPDGFKRDFTDFILASDNFEKFMNADKTYFAKCYNDFERIQKANVSYKGSQRQLKPTFEKFDEYVDRTAFNNVPEGMQEFADVLFEYYYNQSAFDEAISILNEWKENGAHKQILKEPVKDPFDEIKSYEDKIEGVTKDTLVEIKDNLNYSYEWLDKDHPYNYILGLLCSCCSHLEAMGYGIMKASIVNPDIQNLILKENGKIVSKATMYVNREKGYGLINTAEGSDNLTYEQREAIYGKLKIAVKGFAEQYNRENPTQPLKLVNIGMGMNKLESIIRLYDKKSLHILPSPVYGAYGKNNNKYNGDSDFEQYILWENEEIEK